MVAVLLAACASPSGPHVMVLPGNAKTLDQFQADDVTCRQWAVQQPGTTTDWRYDMAYMQCMYAKGHEIPVSGGPHPSYQAQPPAATPPSVKAPPSSEPH